MVKTLHLGKTATIKTVEELLDDLSHLAEPHNVRVVQKLTKDDLGGHAAYLQLLATWARQFPSADLKTYISPETSDQQIEAFLRSDHGVFAALIANRITDNSGKDITHAVRQSVLRRLEHLNDRAAKRRGSHLLLVAADHTTVQAAPDALYQSDPSTSQPSVGDAGVFGQIANRVIRAATVGPKRRGFLARNSFELGLLLMELYTNTDDWARTRPDFTRLNPSVRLIRAEGYSRTPSDLSRLAAGDTALETYLAGSHFTGTESGAHQYLEIDVLDTGAGLAAGRLFDRGINSPTLAEELDAARYCLSAYGTTWKGHNREFRGLGLVRALEHLTTLHGFVRVRSGRLSLYRDLLNEPYQLGEAPDLSLRDWTSGTHEATERAPVQGTLFTIVVPTAWETDAHLRTDHDDESA